MPATASLLVKDLKLDLENFRTVRQPSEHSALHAMIAIGPNWFWALTESLLDDGYLPTENILVLKGGKHGKEMIVKEGNRRTGALKLISGHIRKDGLLIPSHIKERIDNVSSEWKGANKIVPCAIYETADAGIVDKIVTLTHGKGDKAGRDKWKAVARARHNRDK